MFNKKRIFVFVVFILFMFIFITFAGGTPQNQAVATRLVTFIDGYDNSEISQQKVIVGEDAEVPDAPKHDAMAFAGWYLEEDRTIEVTDFTNIITDLTVVAEYGDDINRNGILDEDEEYYTVRFVDGLTNTVIKTQTVLNGMNATAPQAPKHDGYTFVGWSRGYTNVEEDITVNAVYQANTNVEVNSYNVTFIDGDTKEIITIVEVQEGLSATLPEAPKHDKRVFDHWEGNYTQITKDETVIAIYADDINDNNKPDYLEDKYSVIYEKGLEEVTGEVPKDENEYLENTNYTVLDNETMELEKAVFIGWSKTNPEKKIETLEELENLVLVRPEAELKIGSSNVTYYAVWANDENGNNKPDYRDKHYTVEFTVDDEYANLVTGTKKFENILEGLNFYDEVKIPGIVENKEDNVAFDKWEPVLPEEDAKVTANMTFKAIFAKDENNNEIPDSSDEHYTVEFTVDSEYANLVTGTMKFENILEGLNFYDEVTIPEIIENNEDKIAFDKWEPVLPEEDAKVTANMTFKAIFAKDENNNEIPDSRDTYFTVTFLDDDGSIISSSEVLSGLSATVPNNPEKGSTAQYNYSFIGWYKGEVQITDFTNIQEDLTVIAKYNETVRKYKVIFKDYYGTSIKEVTVDYGTSVEAPSVATEIKLSGQNSIVEFTGWSTDEYLFVKRELVVKAEYNMLKSSTTTLYKLPSYLIRQEDGGADDREFSSLAEITIKDDAEGNLGKIMSNTKEGEYKLAVGKDDVLKYLTEESRTIVENNNADIYVLKYNPKDGWHLDCQINNEDIAVYRNGNNGLKVISNSHNITKVERYEKKYVFPLGMKWVKQEEHNAINQSAGIYIISDFSVNIEGNNSMYRIYYDNNKYVDYYWNEQ